MKKILLAIAAGAMLLTGCVKGLEDRVSVLEEKVASLEEVVAALNVEVSGISTIVSNLQKKVYVTGVEKIMNDTGVEVGYKISFTEGEPVIIYHGQTGPEGQPGVAGLTPSIDIFEGVWYWKYEGGDWILDHQGKKIPAVRNLDFEVGADGHLYVTIEGGSKIDLGNVTGKDGQNGAPGTPGVPGTPGDKGEPGDSWFDGVTVDETSGTVTISIKDSEHDIVLPLYQFTFKVTVPDGVKGIAGEVVPVAYSVCESAAASTVVRAYPSKGIEAEVDRENNVINVTLSTVDGYVDVYAINNATGDIKAQTVEFKGGEEILVGVKETEFTFAPDGTTEAIEIPVSTAVEYEVEAPSWITYEVKDATKAVRDEVITLSVAEANTTAKDYKGNVVLKDKDGKEIISFAVLQKNYYPELIADAEGKPIQWAESFDIYRYESDIPSGQPNISKKGVFTIALSDDFSKGVYKISNMFFADNYFGEGYQMISNKGGEYYADIEGNVLTVKKAGAVQSYGFTSDIEMTYDAENNTISFAGPVTAQVYYGSLANRQGYIVNYNAVVKVEAPAQEGSIAGEWNQTVVFGANSAVKDGASAVVTVGVNGNQITLENFIFAGSTATGTLEGNTITVSAKNSGLPLTYGPADSDIIITLSEDNRTMTASNISTGYGYGIVVTSWTAESTAPAAGEDPLAQFSGPWTETYVNKPYAWSSETVYSGEFTVSVVDGKLYFENMFTSNYGAGKFYGTLSEDGKTISLEDAEQYGHPYFGPLSYAGPITLTVEGNTLKVASAYNNAVANYVATKK